MRIASRKMQKDLKAGLAVGLALAAGVVIWIATRPSMSPEARMPQGQGTVAVGEADVTQEANEPPAVSVIPRSPEPNVPPAEPNAAPPEPVVAAASPVETPAQEPQVAVEKPQGEVFDSTIYRQTEKIETQRFYVVRRGDTLSKISMTYYGSANQWRKIFEANKETIPNPDKLTPGVKLIIP